MRAPCATPRAFAGRTGGPAPLVSCPIVRGWRVFPVVPLSAYVAVTLDSFYYTEHYPELAANKRPVWVVEKGPGAIPARPVESEAVNPPGGGQTAYVNTWALGPLAPGSTQTFLWQVVPVKAGVHTVHFTVAAGLAGKAKARLASGGQVQGGLTANIAPAPPSRHVDPSSGRIAAGAFPIAP
jgi:hypothetical protein